MRASVASRNSSRVDRPTVPAHLRPSLKLSLAVSSGTAAASSLAVAMTPFFRSADSVLCATLDSHRSGCGAMP